MTDAAAIYDVRLAPEEFEARVASAIQALDGDEGAEIRAYLAWFARRYPSPLERLAYSRRKYREALLTQGAAR